MKKTADRIGRLILAIVSAVLIVSCPPAITPDMVTFAEDEIGPTILISNPVNYSYYYTTLNVSGTLLDSAALENDGDGRLETFSFSIPGLPALEFDFSVDFDNENQQYVVTPANDQTSVNFIYDFDTKAFSFSFPTLGVLNGNYELIFIAVDWRGNEKEERVVIQKDTQGPSIDIYTISPSLDDQTIYYSPANPRTITITGSFGDTFQNGDYDIRDSLDQRVEQQPIAAMAPDFDYSFNFSTNGLTGTNNLIIHAFGNSEDEYITLLINEDSVAPTLTHFISLTSDAVNDGYGAAGNTVTLRFEADDILDPNGIDITIQAAPVPVSNITYVGPSVDPGYYVWEATHVLTAQTNDTAVPFSITRYDDKAGNTGPALDEGDITPGSGVIYDDSVPDLYQITVFSDNALNTDRAAVGDTISVRFWHASQIDDVTNAPSVTINGRTATVIETNVVDGANYYSTAEIAVIGTDPQSVAAFVISNIYNNLGVASVQPTYTAVTDGSSVVIDRTDPAAIGAPTVTVSDSGAGFELFWNSTSTGFSVNVTIPNDPSLLHGGGGNNGYIQFQASQDGGSTGNIGPQKPITSVGVPVGFTLSESDLDTYDSSIPSGTVLTIRAILFDAAGNASTGSNSSGITYDETPPSVSIDGPPASTRTDGSHSLTYTTDGIDDVEVRFNGGGSWYAVNDGDALSTIAGFGALSQGSFTIEVRDRDTAGNYAIAGRTLIKDTARPTVDVSYDDADGYVKQGQLLDITADFSEDMNRPSPAPLISISVPGSGAITNQSMTWVSNTRARYNNYNVGTGTGTATVTITTAEDLAGNTVMSPPSSGGTFQVDNTSPTVSITYLDSDGDSDGYVNSDKTMTITATFSENMTRPTPRPTITIAAPSNNRTDVDMTWVSDTVATYDYNVGSGDGSATVTIDAGIDLAGNLVNGDPPASGGTFYVDNTDPTITIDSPAPSTDVTGATTITFTPDEPDGTGLFGSTYEVRVVGIGNWQTLIGGMALSSLTSWLSVGTGDFDLRVRHTDGAGNSVTDTVTVNKTAD